jgi:hypothetical protein
MTTTSIVTVVGTQTPGCWFLRQKQMMVAKKDIAPSPTLILPKPFTSTAASNSNSTDRLPTLDS